VKRDDLAASWTVLVHPRSTFRRLRARSPVLAPWIVGSVLAVGLSVLTLSVSHRAAVHLAARVDAPELAEEMQQGLRRLGWVSVAGAPAGLIAQWALASLVLWAPATLATARTRYRAVLSVVAYAALPGLFGKALDLGVAWMQGPEFGPDLVPVLSSATSLGALFPAVQGAWPAALLGRLTVFGIWGLVLWVLGLSETLELGPKRAAAVAVPVWVLLLALAASMDVLGRSMTAGTLPG
jgi:hypothetical protein